MADWGLVDKLFLDQDIPLYFFEESVKLRVETALKLMNISPSSVSVKCFCSVDKESYIIEDGNRLTVYMDKHQHDSIYAFGGLFYTFCKVSSKNNEPIGSDGEPYYSSRANFILLASQSEKCIHRGMLDQSFSFAKAISQYHYGDELRRLQESHSERKKLKNICRIIKSAGERQDVFSSYSLNFYVFHEFAHAKYILNKEDLIIFERCIMEKLLHGTNPDEPDGGCPSIPIDEYISDMYALYLLFDCVYDNTNTYDTKLMIEGYVISVLSDALTNSSSDISVLVSENEMYVAMFRILTVMVSLRDLWKAERKPDYLIDSLNGYLYPIYQRVRDFFYDLSKKWQNLYALHRCESIGSVSYEQYCKQKETIIKILSAIR